jgi:TolB protein
MMDYDGAGHRFLTQGQWTVLTPRFAPDQRTIAFVSYENGRPRVYILDVATNQVRPLVQGPNQTFAPRYSPDSRFIVFSMAVNGNTDVYRVPVAAGSRSGSPTHRASTRAAASRPTAADRIRKRSRRQPAALRDGRDGSNQRRISFGGGGHATPEWSPRGDLIAYTQTGSFRVGVMRPDGSGARLLTRDAGEGPTWAPNGRAIMYQRGPWPSAGLVCRRRQRRDPARADAARRLRPVLVRAAPQLSRKSPEQALRVRRYE